MSPIVMFVMSLIAQLPQEISAIQAGYGAIRNLLSAKDQATLDQALAAANTQLDADVAKLDEDAKAHGAV